MKKKKKKSVTTHYFISHIFCSFKAVFGWFFARKIFYNYFFLFVQFVNLFESYKILCGTLRIVLFVVYIKMHVNATIPLEKSLGLSREFTMNKDRTIIYGRRYENSGVRFWFSRGKKNRTFWWEKSWRNALFDSWFGVRSHAFCSCIYTYTEPYTDMNNLYVREEEKSKHQRIIVVVVVDCGKNNQRHTDRMRADILLLLAV